VTGELVRGTTLAVDESDDVERDLVALARPAHRLDLAPRRPRRRAALD
jgi:hypothetical protein